MYVSYIYLAVFLGYSISINPLIGYHYGLNNKEEEIRKATKEIEKHTQKEL